MKRNLKIKIYPQLMIYDPLRLGLRLLRIDRNIRNATCWHILDIPTLPFGLFNETVLSTKLLGKLPKGYKVERNLK